MDDDSIDKIRQTEAKFRLLFDNPSDAVWVFDLTTQRFAYVSQEVEHILGYQPLDLADMELQEVCTPNCMSEVLTALEEAIARLKQGQRQTISLQTDLLTKDGRIITLDVDWRLYRQGEGYRAIGLLRDPARRKKAERYGGELAAQLEELIAERDRLRWEVKVLQGLLPICASCKRIRDSQGKWHSLEAYLTEHSEAQFTHTICPPCAKELYPDVKLSGQDVD